MSKKSRWLRYLPVVIAVVLILIIAALVYYFRGVFEKPVSAKKQVQQVTIVQPPPPPPPPPEQPPPPPEVKEEKIEEPEPEPEPEPEQAEEPPPGEDLGVDAEGGAGGDAFGLVGKKGGHGLLGGGGGNAFIYYGQQLQRQITDELQQRLASSTKVRGKKLTFTAQFWVAADGTVRADSSDSTGNPEVDSEIRTALASCRFRAKTPPEGMKQPLRFRIRL